MKNLVLAFTMLVGSSAFSATTSRIHCDAKLEAGIKVDIDVADLSRANLFEIVTSKHAVTIENGRVDKYSFQLNPSAVNPLTNESGIEFYAGVENADYDRVFLKYQGEGKFDGSLLLAATTDTAVRSIELKCFEQK